MLMYVCIYICTYEHDNCNYVATKFLTLSINTYCVYTHIGVSNLRSATTNTTIIITWDPADSPNDCGPVLRYTVTATSLDDDSISSPERLNIRVAEFSSLINGTFYNISVAAVNRAGTGPSSTIIVTGNTGIYRKITFSVWV